MGRSASARSGKGPSSSCADGASTATLAVIGLSGPESLKGSRGAGKSALANRLVRPHYLDFRSDAHLSYLSQADFSCSPVVNGEHWLYWGEAALDSDDYKGPTTRVRVIEQTVFLDDETFRPLGDYPTPTWDGYVRRALCTNLACRGKLMYLCREQLGQESDFPQYSLPQSNQFIRIDAFCVLFDVSRVDGRVDFAEQASLLHMLLSQAVELKRPVFLAASKVDCADARGLNEFRKLCNSRKLKGSSFFHSMELSALENVNVTELLYCVATSIDRKKWKLKLSPYSVALNSHDDRSQAIRQEFDSLISTSMESGDSTWQIFLQRPGMAMHPAYLAFIAQFGPQEAERVFKTWAVSGAAVEKCQTPRLLMCGIGCSTIVVVDDESNRKVSVPHPSSNFPALSSPRRGGDGEECSTLSSHHSSPASSISYGGRHDEASRPSPPHSGWPPRKQRPAPPPPPSKPTRCELAMSQSSYSGGAESQASSHGASRSRSSRDTISTHAPSVKTRTGRNRSVAPTPERAALIEDTNDSTNARGKSTCRRLWGTETSKPGRGLLSRTKSQYVPITPSTGVKSKGAAVSESQLNTFVTKCIEYIESNGGLEVEGIYRVPGSRIQMAALEKKFKKPGCIDLAAMDLPVQVVATALKRYLDLMPEPLVGPLTHADALQSLVEHSSKEELKLLKELVEQNIPAANIVPLANLLHHLWKVHLNSHLNAMDCKNLAKVWSPTLFRPTFESFEAMTTSLSRFETATYVLLTRCNAIFSHGDV